MFSKPKISYTASSVMSLFVNNDNCSRIERASRAEPSDKLIIELITFCEILIFSCLATLVNKSEICFAFILENSK